MSGLLARCAIYACGIYFAAGLIMGLVMQSAIPAMNYIGVAYYAATWPAQIYCASEGRACDASPRQPWAGAMFDFPEVKR